MQHEGLGGVADHLPLVMPSSGLLTGPLYEEGLDIPLRSLCIDVVLIEYPQQHTSTRCPLKDYPWTTLRSHLG